MHTEKIHNINFMAGEVNLRRLNPDNINNYDKIKKLAEDTKLDFYIYKNQESKYLPFENSFIVTVKKEDNKFPIPRYGMGCAIVNKNATKEKLSEKIYNAIIDAMKRLNSKIVEKTGKKSDFIKFI